MRPIVSSRAFLLLLLHSMISPAHPPPSPLLLRNVTCGSQRSKDHPIQMAPIPPPTTPFSFFLFLLFPPLLPSSTALFYSYFSSFFSSSYFFLPSSCSSDSSSVHTSFLPSFTYRTPLFPSMLPFLFPSFLPDSYSSFPSSSLFSPYSFSSSFFLFSTALHLKPLPLLLRYLPPLPRPLPPPFSSVSPSRNISDAPDLLNKQRTSLAAERLQCFRRINTLSAVHKSHIAS